MEPYRGRGMPDLPWKGGCGFQAPPGPPLSSCSPSSSWTSWARTAVLLIWSLLVGMIWGLLAGVGAVLSAVAAIVRAPIARRKYRPHAMKQDTCILIASHQLFIVEHRLQMQPRHFALLRVAGSKASAREARANALAT